MPPFTLRLVVVCCLVSLCSTPTAAQPQDAVPATWNEVEAAASDLYEQERFDEALTLVSRAAPGLPDREFEISDLTLSLLFGAGRGAEALDVWEQGLAAGYFYFVVPRFATYDVVRNEGRFKELLARNNERRERAESEARSEFKVITPASFDPDRAYPLLMIIHGGNQSIVKAMERWEPQAIGDEFLIAYLQSSRCADTRSYRWDLGGSDIYHLPTAQDEVLGLYREIVATYPVDREQVTLAGFSQGGNLALIMAAEGTIPARGFIAGCPATREPISPETARAAAARGLRGTLFVGSEDWTAAPAQATVANFDEAGLPVRHLVMEGKGHEFPDDFDAVLRAALAHIRQ